MSLTVTNRQAGDTSYVTTSGLQERLTRTTGANAVQLGGLVFHSSEYAKELRLDKRFYEPCDSMNVMSQNGYDMHGITMCYVLRFGWW